MCRPCTVLIRRVLAKSISFLLLTITWPMLVAEVNTGELRLKVTVPGGLGLSASITISSNSSHYLNSLTTSKSGEVDIKTLPYGIYLLRPESQGFTATTEIVEVRVGAPYGTDDYTRHCAGKYIGAGFRSSAISSHCLFIRAVDSIKPVSQGS